jgi:uroporphyrinogen III methyltransferase/synthase
MGMKNLGRISETLINEKHFPADTPAAVVTWGTTPVQKVAAGTLRDIAAIASEKGLKPPAIIVVGRVVSLREKLRWFESLPLFGRTVVVTRTREQASVLGRKLRDLGAAVVEFPTIEIKERADLSELDAAFAALEKFRWIVFTSQNAVEIFFRALGRSGRDARSLHGARVAVIGPATAAAVEARSVRPDLVPAEYVAEALIEEFRKTGVTGAEVLLSCATEARDALKMGLEALGARVTRIHLYDTVKPAAAAEDLLAAVRSADVVSFASSSTARNFFALVPETKAVLASIGPVTSAAVREPGHEVGIEASEYTIDGLVAAIVKHFAGGK